MKMPAAGGRIVFIRNKDDFSGMIPSIFRINYNERQLTGIYQLPLEVLL